jgi:glutathione synthase/RimK-type ligase-like ATP-grasp enzyme
MKEELEDIKEIKKMAAKNYKLIKKNTKNINDNFERINQNSYALGILQDYKKDAKRWFVAFIVASILLIIMAIHHFIIM